MQFSEFWRAISKTKFWKIEIRKFPNLAGLCFQLWCKFLILKPNLQFLGSIYNNFSKISHPAKQPKILLRKFFFNKSASFWTKTASGVRSSSGVAPTTNHWAGGRWYLLLWILWVKKWKKKQNSKCELSDLWHVLVRNSYFLCIEKQSNLLKIDINDNK